MQPPYCNPRGGAESSVIQNRQIMSEIIIEAGRTEKNYWGDLWRYRELFLILAWRDLSVRYKQTIIGILWAILRPLLTMVVFTVIFSRIAKLPSDGSAPYALMVFAAMLPWSLFASSLSESSNSLIGQHESDQQGLLSPADHARGDADHRFCRFPHQLHYSDRDDGLLSIRTRLAHPSAALHHHPGLAGQFGSRSLDYGAQCEIPGFPLCHPVCGAVRSLCFSGGIQQQGRPGTMADALQPQSHGGRDRRIPLVHPRRRKPHLPARFPAQPRYHYLLPLSGRIPFPQDGKNLCRFDIVDGSWEIEDGAEIF